MPKKIKKTKASQKQKQKQSIVVNITNKTEQKRRTYVKRETKAEQPKGYLPMMPSFNINQPATQSQASDLSKLVGMLIPKLQTQSTLGASIPPPIPTDVPIPMPSTELQSNVKENLLGESVENKVKKTKRNKQEMAEAREMGGEDVASINLGLTKYNFIPEPESQVVEPELAVIVGKKIRKNSMEDLQQRYFDQRGEYRIIPKGYTIKEFKLLVEKLEAL